MQVCHRLGHSLNVLRRRGEKQGRKGEKEEKDESVCVCVYVCIGGRGVAGGKEPRKKSLCQEWGMLLAKWQNSFDSNPSSFPEF